MKRPWLLLWLVLLLCQILTAWILQDATEPPLPMVAMDRGELEELAGKTLREWDRKALMPPRTVARGGRIPGRSELLEREECLLRLRDLEERLRKTGTEVTVAEDFVTWQEGLGGKMELPGDGHRGLAYLFSIAQWLESLSEGPGGIRLERALLHPGTHSAYPSLSFELSGHVESLGSGLLSHLEASSDWILKELDLNRSARRDEWWLRGSSEYGGEAGP
ncbi:MAG: hypothetical protein R6V45_06605 [Oceanipulchritudo sp.]